MKEIRILADDEQLGYLVETLQSSLEEAKDVLKRHVDENPPLFDIQTIGEAAEDYTNLVAIQRRRVSALGHFLEGVKKCQRERSDPRR